MAAGQRGLLAFWMGGAAAPPVATTAGSRGLLAPWVGGAAAPAEAGDQGGTRSLLAPWLGGAAAPAATGAQAGYRGLLGFWAGGYCAGPDVAPPPTQPGGGYRPFRIPPDLRTALRRGILDEDDLLLLLAACIDGNSLH